MAYYALLNDDNMVVNVIPGKNESNFDWECYYGNMFLKACKRTSYNTRGSVHINGGTPFRKNYAGIGYTYDAVRDAFIPPKPFPSWVLNEETCQWEPPVPCPGGMVRWDETALGWV